MNAFKYLEVILLLSFGILCAAAFFNRAPVAGVAGAGAGPVAATMPVVVVSAKRMTEAQKRSFGNAAQEYRGSITPRT